MLSKGKVKYIHSLEMKKYRNELNAFVAEGNKLVADMMFAFECELILAKPSWMAMQGNIPAKELLEAEGDDIRKASFLKNPQDVLAVFKRPGWSIDEADPSSSLVLALDGIQDPGNLGTILRTADALEIPVVLLDGCADAYNPKTVRASMGAVFRTQPVSMTRTQAIAGCREQGIPLLATAMSADAVDLRQADLRAAAVVIGSEGQGICPELFAAAEQKIIIPMSPRCESLNAAVAATIVLWQMKR